MGMQVRDLAPLVGLSALQGLDLRVTGVSDLAPLAGLTALQSLNLAGTQVCDLAPLVGLSALQDLYLWRTLSDLLRGTRRAVLRTHLNMVGSYS